MFRLKRKIIKYPPIIKIGLVFKDTRNPGGESRQDQIYELIAVKGVNSRGITNYYSNNITDPNNIMEMVIVWTSDFLEKHLKEGGCLTFIGNKY